MSIADLISVMASFASLILAVIAIWLSIVFFKLSSKSSESTTEVAKGIESSVERVEKLFDKLYADTFSMMRDTVSDMRKQIWPQGTPDSTTEGIERRINATKLAKFKSKVISRKCGDRTLH